MRLTRVYATPDGVSHFEDLEVRLEERGDIGALSETFGATGVVFRTTPGTYDFDWHPAPARQLIVLLDGHIELEVGDGETRAFAGGDVLLVEDTTGRGHRTRTTDGQARRSLFVHLPDSALPRDA